MRAIIQTKLQKRIGLTPFQKQPKTDISDERLEWSINFSYNSVRQWSEYMDLYLDLFTDQQTAQRKAQTHSVAVMCRMLRKKYGCSLPRIYKILLREISVSKIDLHEDIINVKTKWDFIYSIREEKF